MTSNRIALASGNNGLKGRFLVASLGLEGSPFERSVVFVCHETPDHIFGVIVNRPATAALKEVWQQAITSVAKAPSSPQVLEHLREGGPKGGPIVVLHPYKELAEIQIGTDVFLSLNSESIAKIVSQDGEAYQIYCGVSSWGRDQIAREINNGIWFVMDADVRELLNGHEIEWHRAMYQYGRLILCDVVGLKDLPSDPLAN